MSERETALTTALRMLRNECHAIRAMSYDAIKDTAGYTNLKVWISRIEEADTLLAKAAGADPVPVCQWREIATAPKDGRMILLFPSRCWTDDADHGEVGYWDEDFQEWGGCGSRAEDYTGPSHWMPLPAPPVALVPAEGDR